MPTFQSHNHNKNKSKKVVVITRAANGIGKSIAIEFARAGYILMINDIVERELKQTVRDILSSLSQKIIPKYMSNNAINQNSHISYFTVEEYGIADTNLKGIYFCIRELVKQLLIYKNLDSDGTRLLM